MKGAFTGAFKDRIGRFEAANRGTLLLDEIGEIPLRSSEQTLASPSRRRSSMSASVTISKRVNSGRVAATNRNLREEVAAGRSREDLSLLID